MGERRPGRSVMRILLIEDSLKLLHSLRLGLTKSGYEVGTAANGELGLRTAMSGAWDVVILDLMLLSFGVEAGRFRARLGFSSAPRGR